MHHKIISHKTLTKILPFIKQIPVISAITQAFGFIAVAYILFINKPPPNEGWSIFIDATIILAVVPTLISLISTLILYYFGYETHDY